jgi:membrane protein
MSYVANELINALNQILSLDQLKAESEGDAKSDEAKPDESGVNLASFLRRQTGTQQRERGALAGNMGGILAFKGNPSSLMDGVAEDVKLIGSPDAKNQDTYSYKALERVRIPAVTKGGNPTYSSTTSFLEYAGYGRTLTSLGFVNTEAVDPIAKILTFLLLLMYVGVQVVPVLFNMALWLLNILNPFAWLSAGIDGSFSLLKGSVDGGRIPETFKPLAQLLIDLYQGIHDLAFMVWFPAMLAIGVGLYFLGGNARGKQVLRTTGTRISISVIGVALVGSLYTQSLQYALTHGTVNTFGTYADYLVGSTFVRTDDWGTATRFAPPNAKGQIGSDSIFAYDKKNNRALLTTDSFREAVIAVNTLAADRSGDDDGVYMYQQVKRIAGETNAAGLSTIVKLDSEPQSDRSSDTFTFDVRRMFNTASFKYNYDLLSTFLGGNNKYSAADYEGTVQGAIAGDTGTDRSTAIYNGLLGLRIEDLAKTQNLLDGESGATYGDPEGDESSAATSSDSKDDKDSKGSSSGSSFGEAIKKYPFNIYNNGSLTSSGENRYEYKLKNPGNMGDGLKIGDHVGTSPISGFGLSDLAMYNFLSTKFKENGIDVVSMYNSSSGYTNVSYQAVTLAGGTLNGYVSLVEDLVILFGMVLIGWLVVSSLVVRTSGLIGNIGANIPGTSVGGFKSFSLLMTYAGAVVVYVYTSLFLYSAFSVLYVSILQISGDIGQGRISFGAAMPNLPFAVVDDSGLIPLVVRILTVLFILVFLMLLRSTYTRRIISAIDKAITDLSTNIASKFTHMTTGDSNLANSTSQAVNASISEAQAKAREREAKVGQVPAALGGMAKAGAVGALAHGSKLGKTGKKILGSKLGKTAALAGAAGVGATLLDQDTLNRVSSKASDAWTANGGLRGRANRWLKGAQGENANVSSLYSSRQELDNQLSTVNANSPRGALETKQNMALHAAVANQQAATQVESQMKSVRGNSRLTDSEKSTKLATLQSKQAVFKELANQNYAEAAAIGEQLETMEAVDEPASVVTRRQTLTAKRNAVNDQITQTVADGVAKVGGDLSAVPGLVSAPTSDSFNEVVQGSTTTVGRAGRTIVNDEVEVTGGDNVVTRRLRQMAPSGGPSVINGGTLQGASGGMPNFSSLGTPHVASQAGEVVQGTTHVTGRAGRTVVNTEVDMSTPDQEVTVQRAVRPQRASLTNAAERAKRSLLSADDSTVGRG